MLTYAHYLTVVSFCKNKRDEEKTAAILQHVMPYLPRISIENIDQVLEKIYLNLPAETHTKEQIMALLIDTMAEELDWTTAGTIAVNILKEGLK